MSVPSLTKAQKINLVLCPEHSPSGYVVRVIDNADDWELFRTLAALPTLEAAIEDARSQLNEDEHEVEVWECDEVKS